MISRNAVFSIAFIMCLILLSGDAAAAVGEKGAENVITAITGAVTGRIGLVVGLVLAIFGIWTWVVKQETAAGIMLIVGGVLFTVSPAVYNAIAGVVAPIVADAGGGDVTKVVTGAEASKSK